MELVRLMRRGPPCDGVGPMQVHLTPQPLIDLFFLHCITVLGLIAISSTVTGGTGVIMTAI